MAAVVAVALIGLIVALALPSNSGQKNVSSPGSTTTTAPVSGSTSTSTTTPAIETAAATRLGIPYEDTASWVAAENAKPGTSAWKLTKPATDDQIAGYASSVSVDLGGSVNVYVSTAAPTFRIQTFRMGYYAGAQGRLVWTSGVLTGVTQPSCPVTPGINMVQCSWQNPVTVATAGWPQGDYLMKLTASTGWQSYVPLTVRDDASRSAYLVNNSVTTWQAYNQFGGYDLYGGPTPGGGTALADRAKIVSFDRPYDLGNGGGDFVGLELPMISMMESLGLDVSYTTDVDLADKPALVKNHRAFITLGHDEYYSLSMRDGLQSARDAGVNLIFLGANAIYRHIRLQASPLGPDRQEIDYKDPSLDPLLGKDNADVTPNAWRAPPNNNPESSLIGEMWQCNPVRADMVITDPTAWVFANTGYTGGTHIPNIVGPEYDNFSPSEPNPGDVTVLARSPVVCDGQKHEADMTYYSAPSHAGVWDTGTIDWVGSIGPVCATCTSVGPVTQVTINVVSAFGEGPAGIAHPSTANVT